MIKTKTCSVRLGMSACRNKVAAAMPTRSISAGIFLHMWSWAGSDTLPVQHHSDWSVGGAHSTACATLPGTPSSHRTSFVTQDASELGRSPWAWAVLCSVSKHLSLGPQFGQRPEEPPTLPSYAPSWPQQLMLWLPDVPEVVSDLTGSTNRDTVSVFRPTPRACKPC